MKTLTSEIKNIYRFFGLEHNIVHRTLSCNRDCFVYRIAGNFRGRKLLWISRFDSHPRKFSSRNLGHAAPTYDWFQAIRESFLREILTSYGSAKVFSLESLPLYSMYCLLPVVGIKIVRSQYLMSEWVVASTKLSKDEKSCLYTFYMAHEYFKSCLLSAIPTCTCIDPHPTIHPTMIKCLCCCSMCLPRTARYDSQELQHGDRSVCSWELFSW